MRELTAGASSFTWNDLIVICALDRYQESVKRVLTRAGIPHGSVEEQLTSSFPLVAVDDGDGVMSGEWSAVFMVGRGGWYAHNYVQSSRARSVLVHILILSEDDLHEYYSYIKPEHRHCYQVQGEFGK